MTAHEVSAAMSQKLTTRERRALEALVADPVCHRLNEFPRGVGVATMEALLLRGLVERGPSERCAGPDRWCLMEAGREALMEPPEPVSPGPPYASDHIFP
jgi:hypothetical protein